MKSSTKKLLGVLLAAVLAICLVVTVILPEPAQAATELETAQATADKAWNALQSLPAPEDVNGPEDLPDVCPYCGRTTAEPTGTGSAAVRAQVIWVVVDENTTTAINTNVATTYNNKSVHLYLKGDVTYEGRVSSQNAFFYASQSSGLNCVFTNGYNITATNAAVFGQNNGTLNVIAWDRDDRTATGSVFTGNGNINNGAVVMSGSTSNASKGYYFGGTYEKYVSDSETHVFSTNNAANFFYLYDNIVINAGTGGSAVYLDGEMTYGNARLTMYGGTINGGVGKAAVSVEKSSNTASKNSNNKTYYSALYMYDGTINGGVGKAAVETLEVSHGAAGEKNCLVYIYGGAINSADGDGSYAVKLGTKKTNFKLFDGTITGGTTNVKGAAISNEVGAPVTISDGTINGGVTTASGGAIFQSGGSISMTGGTITGGKAKNGGNVYLISGAKMTMSNGTITGGEALGSGAVGGNVGVSNATTEFTMSGGTISDGVAVYDTDGKTEVTNSAGPNIYMNSSTVNISGGLVSGGLSNSNTGGGSIYATGGNTKDENDIETSDTSKYAILNISGNAIIENGNCQKTAGGNICSFRALITVSGNAKIRNGQAKGHGGNIVMQRFSTLTLKDNAEISGGTAGTNGGNIYVNGEVKTNYKSTLTVEGGTISGGTATAGNGGSIYCGGIFNMSGGTISGGEVYGNSDTTGHGGNIYVATAVGVLTMDGGTVDGGVSSKRGGNIYAETAATVTLNAGALIQNGVAGTHGGNISLDAGTLTTSATILNGVSRSGGGNINGNRGHVIVNGGVIANGWVSGPWNEEAQAYVADGGNWGGNIRTWQGVGITINDGLIYGGNRGTEADDETVANESSNNVGCLSDSSIPTTFTMNGGIIVGDVGVSSSNMTVVLTGDAKILNAYTLDNGTVVTASKGGLHLNEGATTDYSGLTDGAIITISGGASKAVTSAYDQAASKEQYLMAYATGRCLVLKEDNRYYYDWHGEKKAIAAAAATCTEIGYSENYLYCDDCQQYYNAAYTTKVATADAEIAALGHDYIAQEAKAPNCTEIGWDAYETCSRCDYTTYAEISALGHDYQAGAVTAPTCTEAGYTTYVCANDASHTEQRDVVAALGHEYFYLCDSVCMVCHQETNPDAHHNLVHVDTVAATCTENGNVEYWYCTECGQAWLDEACTLNTSLTAVVVPAAHTYTNNCDMDCNACGEYRDAPHTLTIHEEAVIPANCQETGHDEYWICADCGNYFMSNGMGGYYETNPAWINYTGEHVRPAGAASCAVVACELCDEDSYGPDLCDRGDVPVCQDATCVNCGGFMWGEDCTYGYDEDWNPLSPFCQPGDCIYCGTHYEYLYECENGSWAPCSVDGECVYGCGKQYPATGKHELDDPCAGGMCWLCWETIEGAHTEVVDEAVAPTCTETGLTEGKHCELCGEVLVAQETVAALGHSYVAETTPADCENDGKTVYTCSGCGDSYEEIIPATGHSIKLLTAGTPATCLKPGTVNVYTCTVCGAYFEDAEGKIKQDSEVPGMTFPNDHELTFVAGKAATCSEPGVVDHYLCTVCGNAYATNDDYVSEAIKTLIPATGHTEVIDEAVAPTCTETGLTEGKHCSVCGEVLVAQETVAALGHSYAAETTPADCKNDGKTVYTCSGCGDSYEEIIPAGHSIIYVAAVVPANCQETGHSEYWYCTGCEACFGDAEGSWQVNPAWINYTGEHVRPEGSIVCAVVKCVLCGEDSYGETCDRGEAPVCQNAPCVNCGETVWGWGCNYNTGDEEVPLPLCQPGDCVYCGTHYEKLYDCENGSWAPCSYDGECAYGCGKQYPATGKHELDDPCAGGLCWLCWETIEGAHTEGDAVEENRVEATLDAPGSYDVVVYCSVCNTELSREQKIIEQLTGAVAAINGKNYATLEEALAAVEEGQTIILLAPVVIAKGETLELNLNGFDIVYSSDVAGEAMFTNNGTLILTGNGKISYTYTGAPDTAYAKGNYTIANNGTLTVDGATIENATAKMSHASYAITNGNGGQIVLESGLIVNNTNYAVRMFGDGSLTVNGGEIRGTRAVWMQAPGGDTSAAPTIALTVNGGKLNGTGESETYKLAVYSYSYGNSLANVSITVNGGEIEGDIALTGGKNKNVAETVTVTGGKLTDLYSYAADDVAAETVNISGGTFDVEIYEPYCAEGYMPAENGDGTYGVTEDLSVAKIGNTKYATVAEALAVAKSGETVVMLADSDETGAILVMMNSVKLDLNGKTLKVAYLIATNGESTVLDSSDGDGLVIMAKENLTIIDPTCLPVWMAEEGGYRFVLLKMGVEAGRPQTKNQLQLYYWLDGALDIKLRAQLGKTEENDLKVILRINYTISDGSEASLDIVVPEAQLKQYASFGAGTYPSFQTTIRGLDSVENVSISGYVCFGKYVELHGFDYTYESAAE